jgi:hypothetical protein
MVVARIGTALLLTLLAGGCVGAAPKAKWTVRCMAPVGAYETDWITRSYEEAERVRERYEALDYDNCIIDKR